MKIRYSYANGVTRVNLGDRFEDWQLEGLSAQSDDDEAKPHVGLAVALIKASNRIGHRAAKDALPRLNGAEWRNIELPDTVIAPLMWARSLYAYKARCNGVSRSHEAEMLAQRLLSIPHFESVFKKAVGR